MMEAVLYTVVIAVIATVVATVVGTVTAIGLSKSRKGPSGDGRAHPTTCP